MKKPSSIVGYCKRYGVKSAAQASAASNERFGPGFPEKKYLSTEASLANVSRPGIGENRVSQI